MNPQHVIVLIALVIAICTGLGVLVYRIERGERRQRVARRERLIREADMEPGLTYIRCSRCQRLQPADRMEFDADRRPVCQPRRGSGRAIAAPECAA